MIYDTIEKVTGIDFMDNEGVGIYLKQDWIKILK